LPTTSGVPAVTGYSLNFSLYRRRVVVVVLYVVSLGNNPEILVFYSFTLLLSFCLKEIERRKRELVESTLP
jgi:hypothetical protein